MPSSLEGGKMKKKSFVRAVKCLHGYVFWALTVIGLLLSVLPAASVSQPENAPLEAELQVQPTLDNGKVVSMRFTLHNRTAERVKVLKWNTPFEGVAGEIFDIKRDGQPVSYYGILVKRGNPLPEDYISIEPGGTKSSDVNLAESYDFSKAGDYDIDFRSPKVSHLVREGAYMAKSMKELTAAKAAPILAKKVKVKILSASEPKVARALADETVTAKKTYTDCTAEQKQMLTEADAKAAEITSLIPGCLEELASSEKEQYETWFGSHLQTRFDKVVDNFNKLKNAFSGGDITYHCTGPECQNSWYAYVYKGDKIEVFLCPQFWKAPPFGTDSKAGVLIHEVSHEVADTDDHIYGTAGCKDLANTDPTKAIDNADSHEYFSETFECSSAGANYLLYSLLVIFVILLVEGVRLYRRAKTAKG